jgi:hypothetical protein
MILLCGIPSEPPLAMVREQLQKLGVPTVVFNQRRFADTRLEFEIATQHRQTTPEVTGRLYLQGRSYRLEHIRGVYNRMMDDRFLPELEEEPEGSPKRLYCRTLHDALIRWAELAPGRVVNRVAPMGSNFSKPYQAQLIRREGFLVPETLITNEPELVREFQREFGRVIYKSISGVRSIVQTLDEADMARLEDIRWCPVQFQAYVPGVDVRVHVVDEQAFATRANSAATDYRYAARQVKDESGAGVATELEAIDLSPALTDRCVGLARALGMAFVGIDLKITPDDRVYCFEVNPSPAYSYYEAHTGQPIANALARCLAGMN